jgi:hypothetical protein
MGGYLPAIGRADLVHTKSSLTVTIGAIRDQYSGIWKGIVVVLTLIAAVSFANWQG